MRSHLNGVNASHWQSMHGTGIQTHAWETASGHIDVQSCSTYINRVLRFESMLFTIRTGLVLDDVEARAPQCTMNYEVEPDVDTRVLLVLTANNTPLDVSKAANFISSEPAPCGCKKAFRILKPYEVSDPVNDRNAGRWPHTPCKSSVRYHQPWMPHNWAHLFVHDPGRVWRVCRRVRGFLLCARTCIFKVQYMANEMVTNEMSKHIDLRGDVIRDKYKKGIIQLTYNQHRTQGCRHRDQGPGRGKRQMLHTMIPTNFSRTRRWYWT